MKEEEGEEREDEDDEDEDEDEEITEGEATTKKEGGGREGEGIFQSVHPNRTTKRKPRKPKNSLPERQK